jgi:hypothetical protein
MAPPRSVVLRPGTIPLPRTPAPRLPVAMPQVARVAPRQSGPALVGLGPLPQRLPVAPYVPAHMSPLEVKNAAKFTPSNPFTSQLTGPNGNIVAGRGTGMTRNQVMALQKQLNSKGYNVGVDGILGPQTKSAWANMRSAAPHPALWNQHSLYSPKVLDTHHTNTVRTDNNQPAIGSGVPKDAVTKRAAQVKAASPTGLRGTEALGTANSTPDWEQSILNTLIANLHNPQIDPATYANAAADAQYGPIIAGLQQQENDATAQGKTNLAQLAAEYAHLSGTLSSNTAADAAAGSQALASIGSMPAGLANALGLGDATTGAAAGVAGLGSILAASQGMLNQSQGNYDRASMASAEQGGINALASQRADTANQIKDLVQQISAQKAARGAFQVKTLSDARQQNYANNTDYTNSIAGLINQKGPVCGIRILQTQLHAGTKSCWKISSRSRTHLPRRRSARSQRVATPQLHARQAALIAAQAKAKAAKGGFGSLTPGQAGDLYGQLSKAIHDPSLGIYKTDPVSGVSTLADPARAVQMIQSMLGASFNLSDPKVHKWLMNFLRGQNIPLPGVAAPGSIDANLG